MQDDKRSLPSADAVSRRAFVIGTASVGAAAMAISSFPGGVMAAAPSPLFVYSAAAVPIGAVWNGMAFNDFTGYVARYTPPKLPMAQAAATPPRHNDFWSLYYTYA